MGNPNNRQLLVDDTELAIARLLAELEVCTGGRVAGIQIRSEDVSTVADPAVREIRHVFIELHVPRVSQWAT